MNADRPVALVTGSSRGIGRAVLLKLAKTHDCVVHCREDLGGAERVADEATRLGARVAVCTADLGDTDQVEQLLKVTGDTFGRLDTLVASAAATKFAPVLSLKSHHIQRTMAIVVGSYLQLVQGMLDLRLQDETHHKDPTSTRRGGRIIAVGGLDARFAQSGHGLLGAAKAAVEALTRSVAVEVAPFGFTANVVIPGAVQTDSLKAYFAGSTDSPSTSRAAQEAMVAGTPVQRLGTTDDVAELVGFLASEEAGFITGQMLVVDGGVSAEGGAWSQFRNLWT